jgi:hypothetical protein
MDEEGTPVLGAAHPFDQGLILELVEQVDHRGAVDRHRGRKLDLGYWPRLRQCAQHAPGPRRQPQRFQPLDGQNLGRLLDHEQQLAYPPGLPPRRN